MEIAGNERADTEAKHVATTPAAFQYLPVKSCRTQKIKTMAKEQWNKTWLTEHKQLTTFSASQQSKESKQAQNYNTEHVKGFTSDFTA
jgi:hypothetical protein